MEHMWFKGELALEQHVFKLCVFKLPVFVAVMALDEVTEWLQ